jgi:hypothetical protein
MADGYKKQREIEIHPKAAPALFLNFAQHNLITIFAEVKKCTYEEVNGNKKKIIEVIKNLQERELEELARYYLSFLRAPEFLEWEVRDYARRQGAATQAWQLQNTERYTYEEMLYRAAWREMLFVEKEEGTKERLPEAFKVGKTRLHAESLGQETETRCEVEAKWRYGHMKEVLALFYEKLDVLRNLNSHLYHHAPTLQAEGADKDFRDWMERLFEQAKEKLLAIENASLNSNPKGTRVKYKKVLTHHSLEKKTFQFFYKKSDETYKFDNNNRAMVFLGCLFLNKGEAETFMSKVNGFKKTGENKKNNDNSEGKAKFNDDYFKATRDIFSVFSLKRLSRFHTDKPEIRALLDIVGHVSRVPSLYLPYFRDRKFVFCLHQKVVDKLVTVLATEEAKSRALPKRLARTATGGKQSLLYKDFQQQKKSFAEKIKGIKTDEIFTSYADFKQHIIEALEEGGEAIWENYQALFCSYAMGNFHLGVSELQKIAKSLEDKFKGYDRATRNKIPKSFQDFKPLRTVEIKAIEGKVKNAFKADTRFFSKIQNEIPGLTFQHIGLRPERNRTAEFYVQYLDHKKALKNIRFRLVKHSAEKDPFAESKTYHNGIEFKKENRLRLRRYARLSEELYAQGFRYEMPSKEAKNKYIRFGFFSQNHFERRTGKPVFITGRLSHEELKHLVFTALDGKAQEAEQQIIKLLEAYYSLRLALLRAQNNKDVEEAYQSFEQAGFPANSHFLPSFLLGMRGEKQKESPDSVTRRVTKRLEFLEKDLSENPPQSRYEKIKFVVDFIQKFRTDNPNPNVKKYLHEEQYEKLQILVGRLADPPFITYETAQAPAELQEYLKNQHINAEYGQFNFASFVGEKLGGEDAGGKTKNDFALLFESVLNAYKTWISAISSANDEVKQREGGLRLSIHAKNYSLKNVQQKLSRPPSGVHGQAGKHYTLNFAGDYYLPKKFIFRTLRDYAGVKQGNSHALRYRVKQLVDAKKLELPPFVRKALKSETEIRGQVPDAKFLHRLIGKINDQQTEDNLCLLIGQHYLEQQQSYGEGKVKVKPDFKLSDLFKQQSKPEWAFKLQFGEGAQAKKVKLRFLASQLQSVQRFLFDKRSEKILAHYLPQKEEVYWTKPGKNTKAKTVIHDIEDAYKRILGEQLEVVSLLLMYEREGIARALLPLVEDEACYKSIEEEIKKAFLRNFFDGYAFKIIQQKRYLFRKNKNDFQAEWHGDLQRENLRICLENAGGKEKLTDLCGQQGNRISSYTALAHFGLTDEVEKKDLITGIRNAAFHNKLPEKTIRFQQQELQTYAQAIKALADYFQAQQGYPKTR